MKKIAPWFVLLLFLFSSVGFAASLQSLNKNQIIQALQDKTITIVPLVTHDGQLINNSIFVYFSKQNQIVGKFANPVESEPLTDQGTWAVNDNNMLCVTWQQWFVRRPICVSVYNFDSSWIFVNPEGNKIEMMAFKINDEDGNQIQANDQ